MCIEAVWRHASEELIETEDDTSVLAPRQKERQITRQQALHYSPRIHSQTNESIHSDKLRQMKNIFILSLLSISFHLILFENNAYTQNRTHFIHAWFSNDYSLLHLNPYMHNSQMIIHYFTSNRILCHLSTSSSHFSFRLHECSQNGGGFLAA